jgi:hypothetical protein
MFISSVDSKKRNRTYAGINPPKQDALFFVPMQGSDRKFAQPAPVVPSRVSEE